MEFQGRRNLLLNPHLQSIRKHHFFNAHSSRCFFTSHPLCPSALPKQAVPGPNPRWSYLMTSIAWVVSHQCPLHPYAWSSHEDFHQTQAEDLPAILALNVGFSERWWGCHQPNLSYTGEPWESPDSHSRSSLQGKLGGWSDHTKGEPPGEVAHRKIIVDSKTVTLSQA